MTRPFLIACLLLLGSSQLAWSTDAVPDGVSFERVLVPIAIRSAPGAFDSTWVSHLFVTNREDGMRSFDAREACPSLCFFDLFSGQSRRVNLFPRSSASTGQMIYVQRPSERVGFYLRVQDASREAFTWGTEIPVVREKDFFSDTATLLNLPVDARFRNHLRVYALESDGPAFVRATVLNAPGRVPLASVDLLLEGGGDRYSPLYAQVSDLIPTSGFTGLILELTPLTPGLRFWGFLSVTNNETQQVTTVTPAR